MGRRGTPAPPGQALWRVGKYIRLSREDGGVVSESVVNQNRILDDELPGFFAPGTYAVVDTYVDDGTSGTTDAERADFQRMAADIRSGRINCVVVKNLSRAFRNSANQGRFLEEFIPLYRTRFISLYEPRLDTLFNPEAVHSLEVGLTGFLNEQYAYFSSSAFFSGGCFSFHSSSRAMIWSFICRGVTSLPKYLLSSSVLIIT